jgi:hypothetical protein
MNLAALMMHSLTKFTRPYADLSAASQNGNCWRTRAILATVPALTSSLRSVTSPPTNDNVISTYIANLHEQSRSDHGTFRACTSEKLRRATCEPRALFACFLGVLTLADALECLVSRTCRSHAAACSHHRIDRRRCTAACNVAMRRHC